MLSKRLTKHLKTEEEKKQFAADWAAAAPSRKILADILKEKIEYVRRSRLDKTAYDTPNFAIKQAALNEKEKSYQELLELLDN